MMALTPHRLNQSDMNVDSIVKYTNRSIRGARLIADNPYTTMKRQQEAAERTDFSFNFVGGSQTSMKKNKQKTHGKKGSKMHTIHGSSAFDTASPLELATPAGEMHRFFGDTNHQKSGDILPKSESLENVDLRKEGFDVDVRYQEKFAERFRYNGLKNPVGPEGDQLQFIS